jgi:hypothetical protein
MKKQLNNELEKFENRISFQFELKLNGFKRDIIASFANFRDEFFQKIDPILKEVIV